MASKDKRWGMTGPLSTALPTASETQASDALIEELKRQNNYESASDTEKRRKVLESLQTICNEFVKRVATVRFPNSALIIKDARGKVFTYGSFRLGVYGPGSDIDTLVVAPKYVTREDYFELFPGLLIEMAPLGAITDLTAVVDAFVPIIKFEYSGISIDLIFSRLAMLNQLPPDLTLKDNNLLRGLDDAELRSLNGTRVTDEIIDLVPEPATFRLALRGIKLWAQRRAIYANIMGFPGGVAWAMMVARVCQLYPRATGSTIISKFFGLFRQWPWPQPVLLKAVEDGPLSVRVWNPTVYKGDQFHLMPIITPAYPSMCATYNVTKSALTIIQREFERGHEIADKIMTGKAPWQELFVKHTFFTSGYKYYLSVVSASTTKDAHKVWSGYVESKVRLLVQGLERHPSIALAHPFNKGYERTHRCQNEREIERVQAGSLDLLIKEDDIARDGNDSPKEIADAPGGGTDKEQSKNDDKTTDRKAETIVYTTTHYIGLDLNEGAKSLDLSFQVNEFRELCASWTSYNHELNALSVQHVRNFNLPDDVFEPGEVKPTKPIKKAPAKKTAPADGTVSQRKRHATDVRERRRCHQLWPLYLIQDTQCTDTAAPAKRQQTSVAASG